VVARRRGDEWHVGGITGWQGRDLTIDCSFLPAGRDFVMTAVEDGPNADRRAIDHRFVETHVTSGSRLRVRCANGGGWVARFRPVAGNPGK
jgi:alpha-glucosidase